MLFLFQVGRELCDSRHRRTIVAYPHCVLPGCHLPQGEKNQISIHGCEDGEMSLFYTLSAFLLKIIYKTASVAHVHIETLGQLFFISTVSNYLIITCSQRGYWLKNVICDLTLMGSYELHRNITWSKTLFVLWHWCLFVADVLQEVGGFLDVDWSHALGQKHMGHGGHICSHHGCDRWHGTTARR